MSERREINCLGLQTFSISTALLRQIPYFKTIFEIETEEERIGVIFLDENPRIFLLLIDMVNYQVPIAKDLTEDDKLKLHRLANKMDIQLIHPHCNRIRKPRNIDINKIFY